MSTTSYVQDKATAKSSEVKYRIVFNFLALGMSVLAAASYSDTLISIIVPKSDGSSTEMTVDSLGKIDGSAGYQTLVSYSSDFGFYLLIGSIILSGLLFINLLANDKKINFCALMLSLALIPLTLINAYTIISVVNSNPFTASTQTHINTLGLLYIPGHYLFVLAYLVLQSPRPNKKQKMELIEG